MTQVVFTEMAFVKSKNGLRLVQKWSSSKSSSTKWPSPSPKMIFVEIIFAEMAYVQCKVGLRQLQKWSSSTSEKVFVQDHTGLRRNPLRRTYRRQNGLRRNSFEAFGFTKKKSPSAQNAEGKESPVVRKGEGREVLRHKMPRARKVLSCEKAKAEKSFGAKCRGQEKSCRAKSRRLGVVLSR